MSLKFNVMGSGDHSVMVVDDDPLVRDIVKTILSSRGVDVIEAVNGTEALQKAESENPRAIILDIMLPGMTGFEICERLKLNPKTVNVPILFLTSKSEVADFKRAMNLGAFHYFTKPFSPQQLLEKVLEIL